MSIQKLNEIGESRSYPTDRAIAIRNNDTDDLEGIPARATIIDIGYVLTPHRTGFRDVQAIRVVDTRFIMSFPQQEGGTVLAPMPLFTNPPAPRFQIVQGRRESKDIGSK